MPDTIDPSPYAFGFLPGANLQNGINGPGCLTYFGHSYFDPVSGVSTSTLSTTGGLVNSDQSLFKQSLAALGLSEAKVINYACSQSCIIMDNTGSPTGSKGGHVQTLQSYSPINIRQGQAGKMAPWTSNIGLTVLLWGINDIQAFAGGSQDGLYRKNYIEAWRTVFSRVRSGAVYEALTDTNTAFSGGGLGGGTWSSVASTTVNSGTGFARTSTVGATATISIPSDYDGGAIALLFIGRKGLLGGQANITIDGVLVDTINTSNVTADSTSLQGTAVSGGSLVLTRRYFPAAFQAHTIVITTTGIDANFDYNCYQIEAKEGGPIIYATTNRLRTYAGGVNHDNDILVWNQMLRDFVNNEFSGPIEEWNLDAAINESLATNTMNNERISYDTIHLSELGSRYGAAALLDAYIRLNFKFPFPQTTTNQRDTIGSGFYIPQAPTVPNQYLYPGTLTSSAASALTAGGTKIYFVPIVITRPCTLSNVVFDSQTVGTGSLRLGLYHDKGNVVATAGTVQGPFQLMYDWGDFASTAATPSVYAIPAGQGKIVVPGVIWLAVLVKAASTASCTRLTGGHPYVNSSSFGNPRPGNGACYVATFGAAQGTLPISINPLNSTQGTDPNCPFVALSVATVP